jgi:hypothetical protein
MRTPQRVEQFHKEVEIKKAKALRDELRRQQAAAGSTNITEHKKHSSEPVADPVDAPAVIEAAPEEVIVDSTSSAAELETAVEVATETTESEVAEAAADTAEPVVATTTTRKRRS